MLIINIRVSKRRQAANQEPKRQHSQNPQNYPLSSVSTILAPSQYQPAQTMQQQNEFASFMGPKTHFEMVKDHVARAALLLPQMPAPLPNQNDANDAANGLYLLAQYRNISVPANSVFIPRLSRDMRLLLPAEQNNIAQQPVDKEKVQEYHAAIAATIDNRDVTNPPLSRSYTEESRDLGYFGSQY